jgi:hypothetical protein
MEAVKRKNVALRTLLEAVEIPNPDLVLDEGDMNSRIITGSDNYLHFHDDDDDDDIITTEDKKVDQTKAFNGKPRNTEGLDYKKKTDNARSRSIKSSQHAKKLPLYHHPSSQSNRISSHPKDIYSSKKTLSGLVPDLLQPDLMSLKI